MINLERKISRKNLKEIFILGKNLKKVLNSIDESLDYNDIVYLLMQRNN